MSSKITKIVAEVLSSGYQLEPDALTLLEELDSSTNVANLVSEVVKKKTAAKELQQLITRIDLEFALSLKKNSTEEWENISIQTMSADVEIVSSPAIILSGKKGVFGYRQFFQSRYAKLMEIVRQRPDSYQIRKISSIELGSKGGIKIAGLLMSRRSRRNHIELDIDDDTGKITAVAIDDRVKRQVMELLLDQLVVLDIELTRKGLALVKQAYSPDIPDRSPKYASQEVYVAFTSDLQVGSRSFVYDAFQRLLLWIQGKMGDERVVSRIRYLVLGGDIVDGIGIYPGQETDIVEKDIRRQYKILADLLTEVPKHIKIIVIPGNHDAARQALPQPAISREYAEHLYKLDNVLMLGNPACVTLHGVLTLIYHGRSLDDVIATTPGMTYESPSDAQRLLLRARHLAPIYGSRTPIAAEDEDRLVIDRVPEIFYCGHMHTFDASRYKGTLILCTGTWQNQTMYQLNMGIKPDIAKVGVVNLATMDLMIRDFLSDVMKGHESEDSRGSSLSAP